jgi:hypothetical protein
MRHLDDADTDPEERRHDITDEMVDGESQQATEKCTDGQQSSSIKHGLTLIAACFGQRHQRPRVRTSTAGRARTRPLVGTETGALRDRYSATVAR